MLYLRYLGNICLLFGQSFILFYHIETGIIIKLLGGLLIIIPLFGDRMWDMVIVLTAFMLLDLSKLIIEVF